VEGSAEVVLPGGEGDLAEQPEAVDQSLGGGGKVQASQGGMRRVLGDSGGAW
jgi:hypothetical protein